jgi:hypothetical protein
MQEFGARVGWGSFGKKGKLGYHVGGGDDIRFGGKFYPNSISMHPPSNGFSTVKYQLNKNFKLFLANAALSDTEHPGFVPAAPAVFRVDVDDRVLFVSTQIQQNNVRDGCRVNVEGFDVLELQVYCNGSHSHVRGVWLEPFLLK